MSSSSILGPPGISARSVLDAVLERVVFLQDESAEVRAELAEIAILHDYPKGNILFYHGDPSDAVYIVLDGRVKVTLMNADGREVILAVMQTAGVFGLVEALDGGPHAGTAITLSACRLAKIPSGRFVSWLHQHPLLHQRLVIGLARMLRDAYEKVGEQALLPVKRRLLSALLDIARSDGQQRGADVVFRVPTHQELAERVGSSRVVISRILKELIAEEESLTAHGRVLRVPMSALVVREEF
jgi:CRP/FNR family transcriptional regulator, cyclic AMP receptor protein